MTQRCQLWNQTSVEADRIRWHEPDSPRGSTKVTSDQRHCWESGMQVWRSSSGSPTLQERLLVQQLISIFTVYIWYDQFFFCPPSWSIQFLWNCNSTPGLPHLPFTGFTAAIFVWALGLIEAQRDVVLLPGKTKQVGISQKKTCINII